MYVGVTKCIQWCILSLSGSLLPAVLKGVMMVQPTNMQHVNDIAFLRTTQKEFTTSSSFGNCSNVDKLQRDDISWIAQKSSIFVLNLTSLQKQPKNKRNSKAYEIWKNAQIQKTQAAKRKEKDENKANLKQRGRGRGREGREKQIDNNAP